MILSLGAKDGTWLRIVVLHASSIISRVVAGIFSIELERPESLERRSTFVSLRNAASRHTVCRHTV